ncbi:MAG: hypothetical protein O7E52_13920 [Candidatus Poribacteria bacterium]|nr:hypothetical protein [Candidatus Poribacteria bacterium]
MHNRYHMSSLFPILVLASIIFGGCDESPSGGSASIALLRGEPVILDSVLAINVNEDRPDGITDTFFSRVSDRIHLWIFWTNVEDTHTVEVLWFSPEEDTDDPPFRREEEIFNSETGDQITWFFIDQPSNGFPEGEWFVEIFLDGLFERSHVFLVE